MRPLTSLLGTAVLLATVSLALDRADPVYAAKDDSGGSQAEAAPPPGDPLTMFDLSVTPDSGILEDRVDIIWKVQNNSNKPALVEMFTVIDGERMKRGCGFELVIPPGEIFWGGVVGEVGQLCEGGQIETQSGEVHQVGARAVLKDKRGNAKFTAGGDLPFTIQ